MKGFIQEIFKDFINSNKHIRVIKEGLGLLAVFFMWYVVFLFINPLIAFNMQNGAKELLSIQIPIEDLLIGAISLWFIPLLLWLMLNLASFSPSKIFRSFITFIALSVSLDTLNKMVELNVSEQYYNYYLLAMFILTVVFAFGYTRINLVNITEINRSDSEAIIAHDEKISVDIMLGKKSRFDFLKKLYKSTTYFYSDGNICYECINNGLEKYDHNELILGTKDAMNSTLSTLKFKNITEATIFIPSDYTKSRKYYYGVIRYLEHARIGLWGIKFAGSNQIEVIKANSILETMKKSDMYSGAERDTMSKTEYVEDVTDIYNTTPFYRHNIKLCMEDVEAFRQVSKGMSPRTKMSVEMQAERLKREGVKLP